MKKNKKSKLDYFPKNLRFITENFIVNYLYKKHTTLLVIISSVLIILAILVVSLDLSNNFIRNQKYSRERESIEREMIFWESVVQEYPSYRDAYFKLAVLNFRAKDYARARENLEESLRIDPNFKEGRELEKKLR